MTTKRLTRLALLTAIALIVFLVENAFPPLFAFAPGAKLGLGNAVVLVTIVLFGIPDACIVLLGKCLLGALFSGNVASLLYALPAGLGAFAVMAGLSLLMPRIGVVGIALAGAVVHNAVQVCVACLITGVNMAGLLPILLIASLIAGAIVGATSYLTVRFLPPRVYA